MSYKLIRNTIIFLFAQFLIFQVQLSHAAVLTTSFSGEISDISLDTGSSLFSSLVIGDSFTGELNYGQSELDASFPPQVFPPSAFWTFDGGDFGGQLTTPAGTGTTSSTEIVVTNNDVMGIEAAQFVSDITGTTVSAGSLFDAWEALTFDPASNAGFSLLLLSLDSNLYNNLDYQPLAPSMQDIDLALVFIQQLNTNGELIYEATGVLNQVTAVPLPPAILLFASGLLTLFGSKRLQVKHVN